MFELLPRSAEPLLREIVSSMRGVVVGGPRQSGKTTLVRQFQSRYGGTFVTLDDEQVLAAVRRDPVTFVNTGSRPLIIDEVQHGGDPLIRAIKLAVDAHREPGQFVLSGSAQFLTIPTLSESLAGRIGLLDLWTLSTAERVGGSTDFCDAAFTRPETLIGAASGWTRESYVDAIVAGGYPELLGFAPGSRARSTWYTGYLTTVIERDIGGFADVGQVAMVRKVLALVAARLGGLLVHTDFAKELQLNRATVHNYLRYLEMVYLVAQVPAWSANLSAKVAKTPRVYVTDSGLAANLINVNTDALLEPGHAALGGLLETFVLAELMKLRTVSETPFEIHHYRDRDGREVDFVLESPDGRVVGIEVKASVSPPADADRHLRWMRAKLGERFTGILLHCGALGSSLGEDIWSLPVSTLWGHHPAAGRLGSLRTR